MNYMDVSKEFGIKLKEHRWKRGMNKTEFARFLGISRETERDYENFKAHPSLERVCAMCDILGETMDEFFGIKKLEMSKVIEKSWTRDHMGRGYYFARCPKCRQIVNYYDNNPKSTNSYCHRCGTRLDWDTQCE